MGDIDVQLSGLRTLATRCGTESVSLSGSSTPVSAGPLHQPSTAAVSAVQAAVAAVASRLTQRAGTTGVKVDGAACTFGEQEHDSARRIASTSPTMIV